ncbi:hypothetical protein BC834DRAFT_645051 [Gloeopeniophorella convolvens]|nr:hypothetical protein BC834DRAFT_645051 [Gloeopeniophorella convolvens]
MSARRGSSTAPAWATLSAPRSSSPSSNGNTSDMESDDPTGPSNSVPKRKAGLPPDGPPRPSKSSRTETTRHPGRPAATPPHSHRHSGAEPHAGSALYGSVRPRKKVPLRQDGPSYATKYTPQSGKARKSDMALSSRRRVTGSSIPGAAQTRSSGKQREVIEISSDDGGVVLGDADNPIVLDSDDDAPRTSTEQVHTRPGSSENISRSENSAAASSPSPIHPRVLRHKHSLPASVAPDEKPLDVARRLSSQYTDTVAKAKGAGPQDLSRTALSRPPAQGLSPLPKSSHSVKPTKALLAHAGPEDGRNPITSTSTPPEAAGIPQRSHEILPVAATTTVEQLVIPRDDDSPKPSSLSSCAARRPAATKFAQYLEGCTTETQSWNSVWRAARIVEGLV